MKEIKVLEVNNIKMKCGIVGNGNKPLVILPGISLKSVADQIGAIEVQFARFLNNYTIYVFDRRSNSKPGYTLKDMAIDTIEVIKSLGLKKVNIYGASQGGMVAMYIALLDKELINKTCLVSSAYTLDDRSNKTFSTWAKYAKERNVEMLVKSFMLDVYSKEFSDKYLEATLNAYKDTSEEELREFEINNDAFFTVDLENDLNKIDTKLLVLAAYGDKFFGVRTIDKLVKVTGCDYYYYDSSKPHAVYDEDTDVLDRLERFLGE